MTTTEQYVDDHGIVRSERIRDDDRRPFQVVRVVSLAPFTVETTNGRRHRLFRRLASVDVSAVAVGDWLLCCRVEQGVIVIGEVI